MRLAILSHQAPAGDAIGNSVVDKATFFHDRGAQVRVYLEVTPLAHPRLRPFVHAIVQKDSASEAIRFMAESDLVIVEYGQYYSALTLLPLLAGRKPRIVLDYHCVTPPELWSDHNREALLLGWQHRGVAWCADRVLVHSKFAARELQSACGYPKERIFVIPHPVSHTLLEEAGTRNRTAIDIRAELGLCQSKVVLFVGRLAPNKRLGVLIKALARLRHLDPPVHLVVIGKTQDSYRQELDRCLDLAQSLQISDRFHVLGHVTDQRLQACYAAADLFVMPSVHEGFCIPVVEAMARSVPVVAAHAGALPETVGDAGILFTADDDAELAERMRLVLTGATAVQLSPKRQRESSTLTGVTPVQLSPKRQRGSSTLTGATPVQLSPKRQRESSTLTGATAVQLSPKRQRGSSAMPSSLALRAQCNQGNGTEHVAPALRTRSPRVAFVCFRFGAGVVGGAEKSLARMATALQEAGASVEIFSTCTVQEHGWANELPAGSRSEDGLLTHRFPVDPVDRGSHNAIVRKVLETDRQIDPDGEQEFIRHSIHSAALVANLTERIDELDAIITGPYLAGLTYDVCRAFPQKTLLVSCLHDEAVVRLKIWQRVYRQVGGLLYHSESERAFGEEFLGLNHPRSAVIGTVLNLSCQGDAVRGQALAGSGPYVIYCGRYSPQKNLPLLLDWFRQFQLRNEGKLSIVLTGNGSAPVPDDPWCRNLGFVDDRAKADLLAGARALVHLSVNESLSLVALEAWAGGTPVIAHQSCAVLGELIEKSGGGAAVANFASFEKMLLDVLDRPAHWKVLGENGRVFVGAHYASKASFTEKLLDAIFSLSMPLAECMRQRGKQRAAGHSQEAWREDFGRAVDETLDAQPRLFSESWQLVPHRHTATATTSQQTAFIPIRLRNLGSHAALPDGPGARVLVAATADPSQPEKPGLRTQTTLPGVIVPGQQAAVVVRARLPDAPGVYRVAIRCQEIGKRTMQEPPDAVVELIVTRAEDPVGGSCGPLLQAAGAALAEADRRQQLPDDYLDVTQGRLAAVKLRIKQKLLGNFKHAYVDVLSRRQSAFNRALLEAVQEALECCALLDHAVSTSAPRRLEQSSRELSLAIERAVADGGTHEIAEVLKDLLGEILDSRARQDSLESRIAALEQAACDSAQSTASSSAVE